MKRYAQALAFHFFRSEHQDLVKQVQYLKVENAILRSKLPRRINITPAERTRLLKFGKPLGTAIRHLISIVHPRTFARWKAEQHRPTKRRSDSSAGGRPRKSAFIRDLVLRMARENNWGLTRLAAEIRSLHIGMIGRTTVSNILKEHGQETGPGRSAVLWDNFVARHAETLWACDFLSVRSWTNRGRRDLYLLAFIHVGSRRVVVSPATETPDAEWVEQQARNFTMHLDETEVECSYLLRDRDTKFTSKFDAIITNDAGAKPKRLPKCSPNLNAYIERFVQTIKHECLNHFVIFGERHLNYLATEFVDYYHTKRPHQGIDNRTPIPQSGTPPAEVQSAKVICESKLGGVLKHYKRAA